MKRLLLALGLTALLTAAALAGTNTYFAGSPNQDIPGWDAALVTPSDGSTLPFTSRALWVGTAGTICVDMAGGETNVCFTNATGTMPLRVTKVYATGTTATGIVNIW